MTDIFQLTYISSVRTAVTLDDCKEILAKSRVNNSKVDVTGVLLFNSKRFLQAIEGPEQNVQALFEKISKDPRHAAVVLLNRRFIEKRQFGRWAMAFNDGVGGETLRDRIGALLKDTDPSTRALFETTATMHSTRVSGAKENAAPNSAW